MKRGRPKGRSNDSRSFGPLGDLIRKHRLTQQLGLLDVAQACECSVQFISNIEHGRAPLPWDKVDVLAQVLGVTIGELQAANLAIRSDFKSFVGGQKLAPKSGAKSKKLPKRISSPSYLMGATGTASAMASSATDPELRNLILTYQTASPQLKKRFMKGALKLLAQ